MLKAASPFTVLLVQWMFGLADPTRTQIINILIIVFGVAIASAGTLEFSFIGFFFQLGGLGFEAVRVVLIEVLLSRQGLKMDAMTGLYYSAPVVAVLNLFWILGVVAECCCCFYSELYEYGLDWQNIKPRYVSIRDL
ncbi:putative sugar phosphate/phosphate translocator [Fusarium oxysporum f. sp. raphani]|uniref:GDP-mannose transporter n=2 Tax=Fusarium oxysporum TaxID=5507 RepID=A0A8J5UJ47_FUSOX|nr:putative sugar phosphate/phosphate translocator [Fusarium oxysporum f. sp. raphani]